jgi:hydroxymethylbilane synthase
VTGAVLRLGTRASALATSQSGWVADRLRAAGHRVELVEVRTEGDVSRRSLTEIGGTGVFASALRDELRHHAIDLAVHSLKDLPTAPEEGLVVAAVPEREDPRDALVARDALTLEELPPGAQIGTGSPRRAAQLALARPDLVVRDIRGNVGTRIDLVRAGRVDAVVLACAGLARLGRTAEATQVLPLTTMLPAPGQGALAVECREDDLDLARLLADVLEHAPTRAAVDAERAVLARLEAGCTAPVGAYATSAGDLGLTLEVLVALPDHPQRHTASGTDPETLGRTVADVLLTRTDLVGAIAAGPAHPGGAERSNPPEPLA